MALVLPAVSPSAEPVDPVSVKVTVSWGRPVVRTTRKSFGINLSAAFDPGTSADPKHRENVGFLGPEKPDEGWPSQPLDPALVRCRVMDMMKDSSAGSGWLNLKPRGWDGAKIRRALDGFPPPGTEAILNIPGWPDWMDSDGDGFLDRDRYDEFAAFCATLVKIVNLDLKRGIRYWEITNEKDVQYWVPQAERKEPDRLKELAEIYNACARLMKAADPSILTGGPAAARGDLFEPLRRFVLAVVPNLDFYAFHAIASADGADSDSKVYERADGMGWLVREAVRMLEAESPDRRVPVFLDEYSIGPGRGARDPRMTNNKGAVFDAIVMAECARAGADSVMERNERDAIYGKTPPDGELKAGARVLELFNRYLIGDAVDAIPANLGRVTALAVKNDERGERAVMTANRTGGRIRIRFDFLGWKPRTGEFARYEIATAGGSSVMLWRKLSADGLVVPPHSVTFLAAKD
jgi:xylan 1,4-beta-xylosidase